MGATSRSDALIKIVNTINAVASLGSRGKKNVSLPARNRGKEFALTANVFNFKSTLDRFQSNACVSATSGADDRFTVSLFLFLLITILSLFFEGDIRLENIRVLCFQKTRTFNESIRGRLKNLASNVSLLPHTKRESVVAKNARKSSVFDISRKKEKKNFSQAAMQKGRRAYEVGRWRRKVVFARTK